MHLWGVTLSVRQGATETLRAHMGAASGDGNAVLLHDVTLIKSPHDGPTVLCTREAVFDGGLQQVRAHSPVTVSQSQGDKQTRLEAAGAVFDVRTGEVTLTGPIVGSAVKPDR